MKHKTTRALSLAALFFLLFSIVAIVPSIAQSNAGQQSSDNLITRRFGTTVYFSQIGSSRLTVYDLATQSWQPTLTLGNGITAFDVDDEGLYVAFGRRIARFDLDGSNETHFGNTAVEIDYVHVFDSFIAYGWFDYPHGETTTISKNDGANIDSYDSSYDVFSATAKNVALRRIYGIHSNTLQLTFDASGFFIANLEGTRGGSQLHGLHVAPDEGLIIDDYGWIYQATDLTHGGSLDTQGQRVNDVAFHGSLPLLLSNNVVTAYSKRHEEVGRYTLPNTPVAIEAFDGALFAFEAIDAGSAINKVPISAITSESPDALLNAATLDFEPDFIEYVDGIVYLYSKIYRSIFRYSLATGQYLAPLDVRFAGSHIVYSPSNHSFLSAHNAYFRMYKNAKGPGVIDIVSAENNPTQYGVVDTREAINGIAVVDDLIFTCRYDAYWGTFRYVVEDMNGQEIAELDEYSCRFAQSEWRPAARRLYYSDFYNRIGYAAIALDGSINEVVEKGSSEESASPIRVHPDGTKTIDGSARVRDATTLEQIGALPLGVLEFPLTEAVWYADGLFTLRDSRNDSAQLAKWSDDLSLDNEIELPGKPYYMAVTADGLLVVTKWSGKLYYSVWDDQLEVISGSQLHRSLMPAIVSKFCSGPQIDDFSDPTSGWPTLQTEVYTGGYHNGKYRLLHEVGGYWTAFTRGDFWDKSDLVQIEGQVTSGDAVWGIVFGLNDDWSDFYTLEVLPESQRFFLLHFTSETGWTVVNTNQLSIISKDGVNTLKLKKGSAQNPNEIDVLINDYHLFTRVIPAGRIGLTGGSFEDGTEILYDNYIFGDRYCVVTRTPEQGADSIAIPWSDAALESIDR